MNMSHKHDNLRTTPLMQCYWAMLESIFVTLPQRIR